MVGVEGGFVAAGVFFSLLAFVVMWALWTEDYLEIVAGVVGAIAAFLYFDDGSQLSLIVMSASGAVIVVSLVARALFQG